MPAGRPPGRRQGRRDYVRDHKQGLPSELALLLVMDMNQHGHARLPFWTPPRCAAMRTGAVTAIGARSSARPTAACSVASAAGHAHYWNIGLLCRVLFPDLEEIRIHSLTSAEPRGARPRGGEGRQVSRRVGRSTAGRRRCGVPTWSSKRPGCRHPSPSSTRTGSRRGRSSYPYGTMSAVELSLTDVMDGIVVDDWEQAGAGPLGALRAHVESGRLTRDSLHAELGQIVCGARPGRQTLGRNLALLAPRAQHLGSGCGTRYAGSRRRAAGWVHDTPLPHLRLHRGLASREGAS